MLFEKTIGFWVSKYANFSKLAYKYAIWQPWSESVSWTNEDVLYFCHL